MSFSGAVDKKRNASLLLSLLLFALSASSVRAQGNLVVEGLDASAWPTIRAKIYLLNERGEKLTGVEAKDIVVTENGKSFAAASLDCSSPRKNISAISSVLTIDVSGSMANPARPRAAANIELARGAARAWIEALPEGESECAVTAFDDEGVILRDMTRDRTALMGVINYLLPLKGTNYQAALLGSPAGALRVVERGDQHRVIVFLTDGLSDADPEPIIAEAKRLNARIFCVTLGMPAPPVLRQIAEKTNGGVFENVTTVDEARAVYHAILFRSFGSEPCGITWNSPPDCSPDRTVTVSIPSRALSATLSYRAPEKSIPQLQVTPSYALIPAGGSEVPIRLSAAARSVRIERIEPIRVDPGLRIEAPALPAVIASGESQQVIVRFTGRSGESAVGRWRVINDGCVPTVITVRAGSGTASAPQIHLVAPNGGERFRIGETALLSWDGIPAETPVRLEYSIDAGKSWKPVAENVSGGLHSWRVPATPSEQCLARVSTMTEGEKVVPELGRVAALPIEDHLYALDAAGGRIVGYMGDTTVDQPDGRGGRSREPAGRYGMWNAGTGELIKSWIVVGDDVTSYKDPTPEFIEFSPNGKYLLCGNYMQDANTGKILWWTNGRPVNEQGYMLTDLLTPSFSSDGSMVLLRVSKDGGETLGVLDARTGATLSTMGDHTLSVSTGVFTPDGKEVITSARDGVARWNARTGALLRRFTDEDSYSATVSPDGRLVASVHDDSIRVWERESGNFVGRFYLGSGTHGYRSARFAPDGSPVIWRDNAPGLMDMGTGDTTVTFIERDERRRPKGVPARMVFSPDGSFAVTIGGRADNRTEVNIYDAATGVRVGKTGKGGSVVGLSGAVTADGDRLVWSFGDSVIIAPIEPGASASEDVSDDRWAIIGESKPVVADVDFGRLPVGHSRDSVIVGMVRNNGDLPMLVSGVAIEGTTREDFSHVSGVPPFEVPPGESYPVEFRFAPTVSGKRTARAVFTIDGVRVPGTLRGEGVPERLRIAVLNVDFGELPVGASRDTIIPAMIRNTGTSSVTISQVRIAGPDTASFSFIGTNDRFSISPGGSYPISLRFTPTSVGLFSTRISVEQSGEGEALIAYVHGRGVGSMPEEIFPDPTTFRTMAVPNAVIPRGGTLVAGSYDVLGLMAGYAVTDNIMILAGGAPPLPDDWGGVNGVMFGAYSLGVKFGASLGDRFRVAAGFQWAQSLYDREETEEFDSRIVAPTPYVALSYGDDDSRISTTIGYAFKSHRAVVETGTERIDEFERHAPIVAVGGDYRFANRWKIVGEAIYMRTAGTAPVIATARWFGRTWALDFGAAFLGIATDGEDPPSIPVAPVVSFVWTLPPSSER